MEEKFSLIKYADLLSIGIGWMVYIVAVGEKDGKTWDIQFKYVSPMKTRFQIALLYPFCVLLDEVYIITSHIEPRKMVPEVEKQNPIISNMYSD